MNEHTSAHQASERNNGSKGWVEGEEHGEERNTAPLLDRPYDEGEGLSLLGDEWP